MKILFSKKARDIESMIYLISFSTYLLFNRIVPITNFFDPINGILFLLFAGFGCLLILQDLLTDRYIFKTKFYWVLILFLIVLSISSILNFQYGWVDNLKTIIWFGIHFFVVYTISLRFKNSKNFIFKLFLFLDIIFSVCLVISCYQFIFQMELYKPMHAGVVKNQGFIGGRLFGVFSDPNAAAMISLWFLIFNFYLLKSKKFTGKFNVVINYLFIILDVLYILLSGSRTAEITMFLVLILGLYLFIHNLNACGDKRIKIKILQCIFVVILFFPVMTGIKKVSSHVPNVVENIKINNVSVSEKKEESTNIVKVEVKQEKDILERKDISKENLTNNRFQIWQGYLTALNKGNCIFGLSPRNAISYIKEHNPENYIAQSGYIAHSDYLAVIAYTGFAGFAVFILLAVLILKDVLKKLCIKKKLDDFYIMAILIIFSILLYGFTYRDILFCNTITGFVFWLFMSYILNVKDDGIYEEDSTPRI